MKADEDEVLELDRVCGDSVPRVRTCLVTIQLQSSQWEINFRNEYRWRPDTVLTSRNLEKIVETAHPSCTLVIEAPPVSTSIERAQSMCR